MQVQWTNASGGNWSDGTNWSSGSVPGAGDDAVIAVGALDQVLVDGSFTAASLTLDDAATTLAFAAGGVLTLGTFTITAGTVDLTGGTLRDTHVVDTGGSLIFDNTILDGVTWQGALDLGADATLSVTKGLTVLDASGTGPGTINLTGDEAVLTFDDAIARLDDVTIRLGGAGSVAFPRLSTSTDTAFTIGATTVVDVVGNGGAIWAGTLVNDGTITIAAGSELDLYSSANTAGFFNNTGTITLGLGAELLFDTEVRLADLGTIINQGGSYFFENGIDLGGQTWTIATGGTYQNVELGGTVSDGTIVHQSSTVGVAATFSNITWDGDLTIGPYEELSIINGISVRDVAGTGPGTVTLTGNTAKLAFLDTETLSNLALDFLSSTGGYPSFVSIATGATLTLDSSTAVTIGTSDTPGDVDFTGGTLTSFAQLTQANGGLIIQGTAFGNGGTAVFESGQASIDVTRFINIATMSISNGETLAIDASSFVNTGAIEIGASSGLDLAQPFASAGALTFTGTNALITLDAPFGITATVTGWQQGDHIAFTPSATYTIDAASADQTVIVDSDGTEAATFTVDAQYTAADFSIVQGSNGAPSYLVGGPACFLAGTRILTDRGEVAVEALAIGDRVITRAGEAKPVRWIGRRRYAGAFAATNVDLAPVCICAGALADGVPTRDLRVSPEHALLIGKVLVPARHLVNDASIRREEGHATIEYFHVELAQHDVIWADGAPAETYVDGGNRAMFHNAAEFRALYPDAASAPPRFCAPVVERGVRLRAIRRRLLARAMRLGFDGKQDGPLEGSFEHADGQGVVGWARLVCHPDRRARLEVLVDDRVVATVLADVERADLVAAGIGDGRHAFTARFEPPLDPFAPHSVAIRSAGGAMLGEARGIPAATALDAAAVVALSGILGRAAAAAHDVAGLDTLLGLLGAETERLRDRRAALMDAPALRTLRGGAQIGRRALIVLEAWPVEGEAAWTGVTSHLRALRRLGWRIEVAAVTPRPGDDAARATLAALGAACHAPPAIASVEEGLRRHAGAYALVSLHGLSVAAAYAGLARQTQPHTRLLSLAAGAADRPLLAQAKFEARPELLRHAAVARRQQALAMQAVDAVLVP
ncbi:MAG TPA: Hint domain-containing protein, partial [Acetobacteraceae bacterium]|nr:Hint domain-containing protein [Acetobacteraceae bacterium]